MGTDDPYAETDRIALDEFQAGTYYEWGPFEEYIGLLYKLFPKRTAAAPAQCQALKPYQWEERQQDLLVSAPADHATAMDDPKASNGRALMLPATPPDLEASFVLPSSVSGGRTTAATTLAGRYRVYADIRAEPSGKSGTVVVGLHNPGAAGIANSVALAAAGGRNYVFFSAEDPGQETDTEVFVQVVNQDGSLSGSLQQLTSDSANQYDLDVAYGKRTFHLLYQSDPGTGDADIRVSYMALTPGGPEAVKIVDHRPDLFGGPSRHGRIAMRSDGRPVVVLGGISGANRFHYTQDLTNWAVVSDDWVAGGTVDIAVDSNDRAHIAYATIGQSTHPRYVGQTGPGYRQWGRRDQVGSGVWNVGGGRVQIAVNNDGVHVGWHPRKNLAGRDAWMSQFHYRVKSAGKWSETTSLENGSMSLSPRFLASANELYYFTLPRKTQPHGGPYYQQADDGINNPVDLYQGLTTGLTELNAPGTYLSPAWNGSVLNLASVEMKTPTSGQSALIALYLDVLGTVSEVVVYDNSADHRLTARFTAAGANEYQTLDLGTHDLADSATIWVRPDDNVNATYIDRLFLVSAVPLSRP